MDTIAEDGLEAIVMIAVAQHDTNDNLALVNANAHVKRALLASGLANLIDHACANVAAISPD